MSAEHVINSMFDTRHAAFPLSVLEHTDHDFSLKAGPPRFCLLMTQHIEDRNAQIFRPD